MKKIEKIENSLTVSRQISDIAKVLRHPAARQAHEAWLVDQDIANMSLEAALQDVQRRASDGSPVFVARRTAANSELASLSQLAKHDLALMADAGSLEERTKQFQRSSIVKGTVQKMFGAIASDGFDAKANQTTLASTNLAHIKRNLDKEASDRTKKIREDVKTNAHFHSTKTTLVSSPQQAVRQMQMR